MDELTAQQSAQLLLGYLEDLPQPLIGGDGIYDLLLNSPSAPSHLHLLSHLNQMSMSNGQNTPSNSMSSSAVVPSLELGSSLSSPGFFYPLSSPRGLPQTMAIPSPANGSNGAEHNCNSYCLTFGKPFL
jgi:hypothetical protein